MIPNTPLTTPIASTTADMMFEGSDWFWKDSRRLCLESEEYVSVVE
jgi:hypothetical protein